MSNTLENLFPSHTKEEILNISKGHEPFFIQDITSNIGEILKIESLKSLESLLDFWPVEVDVHLPESSDEATTLKLEPREAFKKYQEGMTLLFNDINDFDSTLNHWVRSLSEELGLSQMTYGRNLVYATQKGGGAATHFDQNMNVIIQLSGSKKWWIAPNSSVINPLSRHTLGLETDPELASYIQAPFPEKMPSGALEFTLTKGSVLYLPQGSWHKTQALSDSLSLNFTFSPPSWLDLFGAAIRARLIQSPKWRETAHFVRSPERCEEALETFNLLLTELAQDAPHWKAQNILRMTEG